MEDINKFISKVFDFNVNYTFDFVGEYVFPKNDYSIEMIESSITSKYVNSTKPVFPNLRFSGLRFKGSGLVKSIIIDTYPETYSYLTIKGVNEINYSADNILKRLVFFSKIADNIATKK